MPCGGEKESCGEDEGKNSTKQDFSDYGELIYETVLLVSK